MEFLFEKLVSSYVPDFSLSSFLMTPRRLLSQTWHRPRWQVNIFHPGDLLILKVNIFQSQHWEMSSFEKVVQSNLRTHEPVK